MQEGPGIGGSQRPWRERARACRFSRELQEGPTEELKEGPAGRPRRGVAGMASYQGTRALRRSCRKVHQTNRRKDRRKRCRKGSRRSYREVQQKVAGRAYRRAAGKSSRKIQQRECRNGQPPGHLGSTEELPQLQEGPGRGGSPRLWRERACAQAPIQRKVAGRAHGRAEGRSSRKTQQRDCRNDQLPGHQGSTEGLQEGP